MKVHFLALPLLTLALVNEASAEPAEVRRFPDSRDAVPTGWTGPVFRLSQDYPAQPPEPEAVPWMAYDIQKARRAGAPRGTASFRSG